MTNKTITFVTSNYSKFEEVKRWLNELDPSIALQEANIDLPEYQSLDIKEIGKGKAIHAWNMLKKPVLIDDGGIFLEQYPLFPGAFSKYVFQAIGLDGVWKLAHDAPNASMKCFLVYCDGLNSQYYFEGECKGRLIDPTQKVINKQVPYTEIFIPTGSTKTLSQLRDTVEEKQYHHRLKALKALVNWLDKR